MTGTPSATATDQTPTIAFLGPFGTFTEQALHTQPDLSDGKLVPYRTVPDVLDAVSTGNADYGFVPIENSIEGMVNFTLDALAFDHELHIVREVVLDIHMCLAALPGTVIDDITTITSIPVAAAQCHHFVRRTVPAATLEPATSTANAAQRVSEGGDPTVAAIAPRVAAELYGLEVIAENIEDHSGNQTRFVLVTANSIAAPTGHDRTAIVVYQRADQPGSLISILQEFAARQLNLTNLISRPTKAGGLGDYCFIVLFEGHIADRLVADGLRSLHAKQAGVKFFGSWPRIDGHAEVAQTEAGGRWKAADLWLDALCAQVAEPGV